MSKLIAWGEIEALLNIAADIDTGFDIRYYDYLNEWLAEIGLDFKHDFNGVSMRFFSLNGEYPVSFITKRCTIFIKFYDEQPALPTLPDYYEGEFTYKFLKKHIVVQDALLENINGFFGYDKKITPKLYLSPSYFYNGKVNYLTNAIWQNDTLLLSNGYIPAIFAEKYGVRSNDLARGIILSCMYECDERYLKEEAYYYKNREGIESEKYLKALGRYDRRFGWDEKYSLQNFNYCYVFEEYLTNGLSLSNNRVSFAIVQYIVERYSKERLFACYRNGFESAFAKTEKQFLDQFVNYLKDIFW